jgi:hypothetical protein
MAAKFGVGQKVKFTSVPDEQGCEKYPQFKQYIGKTGTIIKVFNTPHPHIAEDLVDGRDMGEAPECYLYLVQLGSEKLEAVPEECLVAAD